MRPAIHALLIVLLLAPAAAQAKRPTLSRVRAQLSNVAGKMRANDHPRGVSGPGLAVVFVPMIASGSLLQITTSSGWRQTWLALHLVTSSLWVLLIAAHFLRSRFARSNAWEHGIPAKGTARELVSSRSAPDRFRP